ncbi:MAG: ABC transporter permease [Phycisphaeraceae bacterium]|nr:ABC transporter permease [Phycisphaeraceae bacterium]
MLRFIAWRLLQLPLILLVIFGVTFTLAWLIPGNPLENPDRQVPPQIAQAMLKQYNLDSPWSFLKSYAVNVLTKGDLGPSLQYRDQTVNQIIADGLPVSAMVGFSALILALILGVGTGLISALKPGSLWDMSSLGVAIIGISLPTFVTASALMIVFGGMLKWLPVQGWGSWEHLVLPSITLCAMPGAYIARLTRMGLADIMQSDFIRTARAKGLSRRKTLIKHAMKIAFLPVLSFMGPAAAATMTGSFVVEKVFNLPGLGEHFVQAVRNKDQFLILGVVLVFSTLLVLMNLLVDIAYAWVDPRIELT